MKTLIVRTLAALALMLAFAGTAAAQTQVSCTDATRTVCSVKKNQPFSVTADPALTTDSVPTEKWRMYVNGSPIAELPNAGLAPLFAFAAGLSTVGEHTIYLEAIGTAFDANGAATEIASGPSNVVRMTAVSGSLSAPKNVYIKGGGN
jgi:hypothetical protein